MDKVTMSKDYDQYSNIQKRAIYQNLELILKPLTK
jgi:hypothetical protein